MLFPLWSLPHSVSISFTALTKRALSHGSWFYEDETGPVHSLIEPWSFGSIQIAPLLSADSTFTVLVTMPYDSMLFRIVPCLTGGNALQYARRCRSCVMYPLCIGLRRWVCSEHFVAQCKFLIIISIKNISPPNVCYY